MAKILIVEDEVRLASTLQDLLISVTVVTKVWQRHLAVSMTW